MEKYIDSYNQTNDPFFTKMPQELHICLSCVYTLWRESCSKCKTIELNLLEIMHKDSAWQIWVENSSYHEL